MFNLLIVYILIEREMRKTPLSIRKIDLSAFHGASLAFTILRRGTWNSEPIFYLSLLVYISTHWHFSYYYKKPSSTIRLASPRVVSLRGTITSIGLSPYPSSKVLSQGFQGRPVQGSFSFPYSAIPFGIGSRRKVLKTKWWSAYEVGKDPISGAKARS